MLRKKIQTPGRNQTHDLPNTGRMLSPLSYERNKVILGPHHQFAHHNDYTKELKIAL